MTDAPNKLKVLKKNNHYYSFVILFNLIMCTQHVCATANYQLYVVWGAKAASDAPRERVINCICNTQQAQVYKYIDLSIGRAWCVYICGDGEGYMQHTHRYTHIHTTTLH